MFAEKFYHVGFLSNAFSILTATRSCALSVLACLGQCGDLFSNVDQSFTPAVSPLHLGVKFFPYILLYMTR